MSDLAPPPVPIEEVVGPVAREADAAATARGGPVLASVGLALGPSSDVTTPGALALDCSANVGRWHSPTLEVAGQGVAFTIERVGPHRFEEVRDGLETWLDISVSSGRAPLAFVGGAASEQAPGQPWKGFPAACAWVPEWCVIHDGDDAFLIASTVVLAGDAAAAAEHLAMVLARAVAPSGAAEETSVDATVRGLLDEHGEIEADEATFAMGFEGTVLAGIASGMRKAFDAPAPASLVVAPHGVLHNVGWAAGSVGLAWAEGGGVSAHPVRGALIGIGRDASREDDAGGVVRFGVDSDELAAIDRALA